MSLKKKTILSVLLFVVIFAGLLITATFTDLQVSQILTKGTLPQGQYIATGTFGTIFEIIGSFPGYFLGSLGLCILALYCFRFYDKAKKYSLSAILSVIAAIVYGFCCKEFFTYIKEHMMSVDADTPTYINVLGFMLGVMLTAFTLLSLNNMKDDTLKKLVRFAFACIAIAIVANALVAIVKIPFGRMRFRAMNVTGEFGNFTRWYVANGQPDKQMLREVYGTSDACKSFPSGHTCSAAMIFGIVMLGNALEIKKQWVRNLLWIVSFTYTGLVALSRIMVGAHFFSDVLVGGTIGFLTVILFKEILIDRGSHIKAFKK